MANRRKPRVGYNTSADTPSVSISPMRALGSQPPGFSPGELRFGKSGYLLFKEGGRFFIQRSSGSWICESAEIIFSPAKTVSGVYVVVAMLIKFTSLSVNRVGSCLLLWKARSHIHYETSGFMSNSLGRRWPLGGAPWNRASATRRDRGSLHFTVADFAREPIRIGAEQ